MITTIINTILIIITLEMCLWSKPRYHFVCVVQAVHGSAASKGATKETPHLANLPTKQTTSVTNSLEPGHNRKKENEE